MERRVLNNKFNAALLALSLGLALISTNSVAQTDNTLALPAIISLLLDGDQCITAISVGTTVFDRLDDSICVSNPDISSDFSQYFSFTHTGGPLHIDLIGAFPNPVNAIVALRQGEARDGALVASESNSGPGFSVDDLRDGINNNGHADLLGARLIYTNLAAGRYTIEAGAGGTATLNQRFNLSVYGDRVTANPTGRLNDTGIAFSGLSGTTNGAGCSGAADFAEQDCNFGRDADPRIGRTFFGGQNDGDGHDGFSFLKVGANGEPLLENASQWSCVKDNVTGLMWEVKTTSSGLHNTNNTYTWYDTNPSTNGGADGTQNGGTCIGSLCDTQNFKQVVNVAGLCGHNDWRLPTVAELHGILNYNSINPAIDSAFFPNIPSSGSFFWSASPTSDITNGAWGVSFVFGSIVSRFRDSSNSVRLVRGGQ